MSGRMQRRVRGRARRRRLVGAVVGSAQAVAPEWPIALMWLVLRHAMHLAVWRASDSITRLRSIFRESPKISIS